MYAQADVEPDADRDGFGDETQDQCPSEAATQGACVKPAGTAKKCKKKKRKKGKRARASGKPKKKGCKKKKRRK
jgi:hypothetical protein